MADQARPPLAPVFIAGRHVTFQTCAPIPTPEQLRDIRTALKKFLRSVRLFLPVIDGADPASEMEPATRDLGVMQVVIDAFVLGDSLHPEPRNKAECPVDFVISIDFLMRSFYKLMIRWGHEPGLRLDRSTLKSLSAKVAGGIYSKELVALEQASALLAPRDPLCAPGCACGHDLYYRDDPPKTAEPGPDPLVTLSQAADAVGRAKRTLEKHKSRGMPRPVVAGGRGRPGLWKWSDLRPWLAERFHVTVPEEPPLKRGVKG